MCRLFGMHAGPTPLPATYWLLDAPDSLVDQGERNPDGTGLGWFDAVGTPHVDKQEIAAPQDTEFATKAREVTSCTFVAHVRFATAGRNALRNTHPFTMDGRILAHNGSVLDMDVLEARLSELGTRGLVQGDTDSERILALITGETRACGGDLEAGLLAALTWIGAHCRVVACNLVLTTPTELYAVRWPATHELWVWEWRPGEGTQHPETDDAAVDPRRAHTSHRLSSDAISVHREHGHPAVVIATERMNDDPRWRLLAPGEVLHVDGDLRVSTRVPLRPPAREVSLAQLEAMIGKREDHHGETA